jgi:hypothetical protein
VAIPHIRCTRFNATRSPRRIARALPSTVARITPASNGVPSVVSTRDATPTASNVAVKTSPPLKTPGTRATRFAVAVASVGMNASEVMSPHGASSASAIVTIVSMAWRVIMRVPADVEAG